MDGDMFGGLITFIVLAMILAAVVGMFVGWVLFA